MTRIALFSSTAFGLRCLRNGILPVKETQVVVVATTPSQVTFGGGRPSMAVSTHVDFAGIASSIGCDLMTISTRPTAQEYIDLVRKWDVEVAVVLGWYYLIPADALAVLKKGWVAIHGSLLPRYRGMAPINWAIIHGERRTGATLFYLDAGVDTGDVIAQSPVGITDTDTCASVYEKVTVSSEMLLRQFLPLVASGDAPRQQQDHSQATVFPRRRPEDGRIDWTQSTRRIYDFIRAQTRPYPGAFGIVGGRQLHLWEADIDEFGGAPRAQPGELYRRGHEVFAGTGSGWLHLRQVTWAGTAAVVSPFEALHGVMAFDAPAGLMTVGAPRPLPSTR